MSAATGWRGYEMHNLGLILIAVSAVTMGMTCVRLKSTHIKEMKCICVMLETMQRELDSRLTPLPELFRLLKEKDLGAASFFSGKILEQTERIGRTDFSLLWKECAARSFITLTEQEQSELQRIGEILGKLPADEQIRALKQCHDFLRNELETAFSEYPQSSRLAIGLALSAGAMLMIVLM